MLISQEKKALLLRLRDPTRITSVIPKSRTILYQDKEYVAVRHGVDEVKVLRNMGINAPSPIKYHYQWPGRFKPFLAQRETADFLTLNHRAFCLNDIGTGKTLSTLWAYDYLRTAGVVNRALVVTPLSTMERTWADEVWQHFPHLESSVLYGSAKQRLAMLKQDADLYLINHDGLKVEGIVAALADRPDIDLVIIDEIAQVARNFNTDRFKALHTVVNKQVPRRAWGLTGTPIPNRPTDAWAQCRLLVPERVPPYFHRFRDLVERQVSRYLWVPRGDALRVVEEAMQPAIRFSRDECVDLPPCIYQERSVELSAQQSKAYKTMLNQMAVMIDNNQITAVNEAVMAQKLIQIACLCYDTPVLTREGWVPIQNVTDAHEVWDGIEWVSQKGSVYKGSKTVVSVDGVFMTEDHKVLTVSGWATAKEIIDGNAGEGLNRAAVRLPYSYVESGHHVGDNSVRDMELPMRLRECSCEEKSVPAYETPDDSAKLRVPPRERDAQANQVPTIQCLGQDEATLLKSVRQRLEELRRARDNGVRTLDWLVSKLPRRYFRWLQERLDSWPGGQRRPILARKLPLGDCGAAGFKQADKRCYTNPTGYYDGDSSCGSVRPEGGYTARSDIQVQVGCPTGAIRTYDLVDCGPRNRFVVRGVTGELLIVHNCGALYGADGEVVKVDAANRLVVVEEVIEESGSKVIVFAPFVATVQMIAAHLKEKGYTVEMVYGEVSKSERDRIFSAFQREENPRVLVAQPGAMSHGLTLTKANTILWYAPITSNDIFVQANGRITRPSQTQTQFIVTLGGSDVERRYYDRLKRKQSVQGTLLEAIRAARN